MGNGDRSLRWLTTQRVQVLEVSWGTQVDTTYLGKLADFYKMITVSPWIDSLTEYDTVVMLELRRVPQHVAIQGQDHPLWCAPILRLWVRYRDGDSLTRVGRGDH